MRGSLSRDVHEHDHDYDHVYVYVGVIVNVLVDVVGLRCVSYGPVRLHLVF